MSNQIRRHWEAPDGTETVGKAEDNVRSELITGSSLGPLVFSEATPSCSVRDTDLDHARRRPVSVRGVRHLLPRTSGYLSDRLFSRATVCSAEQATESETSAASASARVQSSPSPSETDEDRDSDMNTVTMAVAGRGRRGPGAGAGAQIRVPLLRMPRLGLGGHCTCYRSCTAPRAGPSRGRNP